MENTHPLSPCLVRCCSSLQTAMENTHPLSPCLVRCCSSLQTAMENTRLAELKEENKRKRDTGVIQRKRSGPDMVSSDPKLDPWVQVREGVR